MSYFFYPSALQVNEELVEEGENREKNDKRVVYRSDFENSPGV